MKKKIAVRNRIFAWILVFVMMLSMTPANVFATEDNDTETVTDGSEEALIDSDCTENEEEISENVRSLQEQINALPTGEEYKNMSADQQDEVYELAAAVSDVYIELSEEDQAKLDITRLEELFAVMNEGVATYGTTMPGARSEYNSSTRDVFLGGNYIEVGISKHGSFGTQEPPKTNQNWHPYNSTSSLGLTSDGDGWDVGEPSVTGDFFLPGNPEERWGLAYKLDGIAYEYPVADRNNVLGGQWMVEPTVHDVSDISNGMLKAVVTGKTTHGVEITITYSFEVNDKFYTTKVDIVNHSGKELTDARFVRSFDPDQDAQTQGSFDTYNKVICNPASNKGGGGKNYAMVVARGSKTLAGFFFVAFDNRARASIGTGLAPASLYDTGLWNSAPVTSLTYADDKEVALTSEMVSASNYNGYVANDTAIALTFQLGSIATGATDSMEFCSSLDPNAEEALSAILNAQINYEDEVITGLEPGVTYTITDNFGSQYSITSDVNGEIPLSGTDNNGISYDFAGKKITIAKQGSEDTPAEIEVIGRPDTPSKPSDLVDDEGETSTPIVDANIEIVELTTSSVIIAPKEGQQYAYSTDGTNWTIVTGKNEQGNHVITGLTEGTVVQIRTRLAATSSAPASQWSESTSVTLKSTVHVTAVGWNGTYDKAAHSISVNVTSPTEGATITYSSLSDSNYSEANPTFINAGEYTVYYRVTAPDYYPAYGSATVKIEPKEVKLEWSNTKLIYNGYEQTPMAEVKADSLYTGDECTVSVSGGQKDHSDSAYTATAIGLSNPNYQLPADATQSFIIAKKKLEFRWGSTRLTYNGKSQAPKATLVEEVPGADLEVTGGRVNVGTGSAVVSLTPEASQNCDLEGTKQVEFKIFPKKITSAMVDADTSYPCTGSDISPVLSVKDGETTLSAQTDYILSGDTSGKDVKNDYKLTVEGKGNYKRESRRSMENYGCL